MTTIGVSIANGERLSGLEWLGLIVAVAGLVYLVFPGLSSPPLISAVLMAAAGIAWGLYTLRGRTSEEPLADTTGNFIRSIPMVALAAVPSFTNSSFESRDLPGGPVWLGRVGN